MEKEAREKPKKGRKNLIILIIILIILFGIPLLILNYQAGKTGMSIGEVLQRKMNRTNTTDSLPGEKLITNLVGEKIDFLVPQPIGFKFTDPPQISNIAVADLDGDGLLDVIVCDTRDNFVSWIRQ